MVAMFYRVVFGKVSPSSFDSNSVANTSEVRTCPRNKKMLQLHVDRKAPRVLLVFWPKRFRGRAWVAEIEWRPVVRQERSQGRAAGREGFVRERAERGCPGEITAWSLGAGCW